MVFPLTCETSLGTYNNRMSGKPVKDSYGTTGELADVHVLVKASSDSPPVVRHKAGTLQIWTASK